MQRIPSVKQQQEKALITQIVNGSADEYAVLIDRYKDGLYLHCFWLVHDESAAEDIAQESFIKAYQKLGSYDPTYRFSTWLYKIATNIAFDYRRRHREVPLDDATAARLESSLPQPDEAARLSELRSAIANLSPIQQSIIVMYYWDGLSCQEISDIVALSVGSVKVRLHRARKELKEVLI